MKIHRTMSRMLLAGTMLAALSAPVSATDLLYDQQSPVPSMNNISAVFDVYGGYMAAEPWDTDNYDGAVVGASGRTNVWLNSNTSMQFDGYFEATPIDDSSYDVYTSYGVTGHLTWRDPERYAFGGFASVGKMGENNDIGTIGVEAQHYWGNWTLYGQAAFTVPIAGNIADDDYDSGGFYLFAEARYFVKPNLMLAGHIAYDNIVRDSGDYYDVDAFRYGIDIEYKHDDSPLALFASLEGATGDWADEKIQEYTIMGGIKLMFGQQTLQQNNNYGVTLEDHNPLYGVNRIRALTFE